MARRRVAELIPSGFTVGGIEAFLGNVLPLLAPDFDIEVLVPGTVQDSVGAARLREAGVTIVEGDCLGAWKPQLSLSERLAQRRRVRAFVRERLREGRFDVVHAHSSMPSFQWMALREAREAGVEVRIAHSHGAPDHKSLRHRVTQSFYQRGYVRDATHLLACSNTAGEHLLGSAWEKRGILATNGIDVARFTPRAKVRERVREGAAGLVVGNVGRLSAEKNQRFLLDVFAEVVRRVPDAQLWLVGDGPERGALEAHAVELGLEAAVRFWGSRADVPDLLQGIDVFVLPSYREGLPVALVEAQAAGLPCLISDGVSAEGLLAGCPSEQLPLAQGPNAWAEHICALAAQRNADGPACVRAAGYDRVATAELLARLYA